MNVLICGTRGVGKSTLALWVARQWRGSVIVFDPRGSFARAGIQCSTVEEVMDHLETCDYITERGECVPLVVHVDADPEQTFTDLCTAIFPPRFQGWRGRLALLIDESATLQSPNSISPSLSRVVGQAPINDVLVIQTTHEIKEWNSKSKSVMDECLLFYQVGPQNYTRISDLCGSDVAELVASLEPHSADDPRLHHFVRYSFRKMLGAKRFELWSDPSVWYQELGQQNKLPGNRDVPEDEPEDSSPEPTEQNENS